MIAFVSGGARSGKSAVAEALAVSAWRRDPGKHLWYLATAAARDAEMRERIARHRAERAAADGAPWQTLEAPVDLSIAWRRVAAHDTVLLDCLTLWASQVMFADGSVDGPGNGPGDGSAYAPETVAERMLDELMVDAQRRRITLVVVSNDLNEDLPPTEPLVWHYLVFLQRLHRRLAQVSDRVVEVVAGNAIEWTPGRASTHSPDASPDAARVGCQSATS